MQEERNAIVVAEWVIEQVSTHLEGMVGMEDVGIVEKVDITRECVISLEQNVEIVVWKGMCQEFVTEEIDVKDRMNTASQNQGNSV